MTFDRISCAVSRATGRPWTFVLAVALVLVWAATGPWFGWSDSHSLFINTATTIVTFLMCFAIQATQNRDSAALQAKLDELIRSHAEARNEFIGLDRRPAEAIEQAREIKPDPYNPWRIWWFRS